MFFHFSINTYYDESDVSCIETMQRGYKSEDRTDSSDKDRDVDSGDLSAWEYLTTNFDDVGFLQEHDCTNPQFRENNVFARKFDVTNTPHQAIPSSYERIEFSYHDTNRHLRDDNVQEDRATHFSIGKLSQSVSCPTSSSVSCIGSQLSLMLSRFLVPLPGPNLLEGFHSKLLPTPNFASIANTNSSTNNRNRTDFQQPRDVHQHPMNLPGFNLNEHLLNRSCNIVELSSNRLGLLNPYERSCNMVELSSNPLGSLNQCEPSNEKLVVSLSQSDVHQSMDYAPPLPPHELLKPLTAYHYFYRVERDNIVQGMTSNHSYIPDPVLDFSGKKLRELLDRRWCMDPIKKRRAHRKTLGKLGFEKYVSSLCATRNMTKL